MTNLELAFELVWEIAKYWFSKPMRRPTERDFLRALHIQCLLELWCYQLQLDLNLQGLSGVDVASVWVDHTPQCWFGRHGSSWSKPSCELADLLVVVWDGPSRRTGRALLVQAKRGKYHDRIPVSSGSSKKEFHLLSSAPRFFLSRQTSFGKNGILKPYSQTTKSEFQLEGFSGSILPHCTFLQIRDARALSWPALESSWQSMWPTNSFRTAFPEVIRQMAGSYSNSLGKRFKYGNVANEWDRLVTVLIDETLTATGGTARGALQSSVSSYPAFTAESQLLPIMDHSANEGNGSEEHPRGIPCIFVTPNEQRD